MLSVCTGAELLARAGLLTGKRATTAKDNFKRIEAETRDLGIHWVKKARWVVDGKIWTSSGVTAGGLCCSTFDVWNTDHLRAL